MAAVVTARAARQAGGRTERADVVSAASWPRSRWTLVAALAAIAILAAGLRLLGITFGLPHVYNPDEISIVSRSLAFAKGDLNPHNFLYPTFYFYVLFAWLGASFVVGWIAGVFPSLAAFQTQFFTDPSYIYLAGRLLGVTCGVATVILTYALGARLYSTSPSSLLSPSFGGARTAGLIAALVLAVAPTHVRDSHYVKHDVPVTLAVVIAQIAILRMMTSRERPVRPVILAGAACGVAFSTHYYAVFLALPLMLALYFRERPHGWRAVQRHASVAFITAVVVFFALSPFILVEPATAYEDIVANREIVIDRAVAAQQGLFANAAAYARMLWAEAIGWPVLLAALGGVGHALSRLPWRPDTAQGAEHAAAFPARDGTRTALVLLAFAAPFLLFISNTVAAGRYLNPVLPSLAAFAALAVVRTALVLRRAGGGWTIIAVAWGLTLLMAVPGFLLSLRLGLFFRQADTRTLAAAIVAREIPAGSTVLIQPYSVPLTQSRESLVEALTMHLGDPGRASTKFALRLALDPYPAPAYRTLFLGEGGLDVDKIYLSYRDVSDPAGFAALRRAGVQYVVLKRYNVEDPEVVPLREQLKRQGRLLASIWPYAEGHEAARARIAPFLHNTDTPYDPALERPGPGIEVWQVPTS